VKWLPWSLLQMVGVAFTSAERMASSTKPISSVRSSAQATGDDEAREPVQHGEQVHPTGTSNRTQDYANFISLDDGIRLRQRYERSGTRLDQPDAVHEYLTGSRAMADRHLDAGEITT
jgi:hypothetical protein